MAGYEDFPKAAQEFEKANQRLMHGRRSLAHGDDDGNDSAFNPDSGIDCSTSVRNTPVVPFGSGDADGDGIACEVMLYSMLVTLRVNLCP